MANDVTTLQALLHGRWNAGDAEGFAALFLDDAVMVGFDGSVIEGKMAITGHLRAIFADHQPPRYVGTVRTVRSIATDVAMLLGVAGLIPPGQADVEPSLNSIQTIVAVRVRGEWRVAQYHNTPAAFDQDPDAKLRLTEQLRALARAHT